MKGVCYLHRMFLEIIPTALIIHAPSQNCHRPQMRATQVESVPVLAVSLIFSV
jgi:hypothetical protein